MIDHLVFLAANEDASPEDIEDLISSIRGLKDTVPGVVDLSVGENLPLRRLHPRPIRPLRDRRRSARVPGAPRPPGRRREARQADQPDSR